MAPAMAAGHSLGEYSAHVAAGTLSFADAVRAVRLRGRYMQEAVPVGEGAMAAILGLDVGLIRHICEQVADESAPLSGDPLVAAGDDSAGLDDVTELAQQTAANTAVQARLATDHCRPVR